jgi:diguanylate cyclase (GGDEF)-like protein
VLIVDDDEHSLVAMRALLAPLAAELVFARSGEQALAELGNAEFAVVLLDVSMPGLDGFETAEQIKLRGATRHLPIIFLTGRIDDEQVRRGYAVGAVDYLLKPFDPGILLAKVGVFVELARLRLQSELLTHRTLHDQLTGLPNRTLFLDRLQLALARLQREPGSLGVLFVDLDDFKRVNDSLGHAVGDQVLIEVAARLRSAIRVSDSTARYGGDEFLLLCEHLAGTDETGQLIERLTDALDRPIVLDDDDELELTASIGAAETADPHTPPQELIDAADANMLAIKRDRISGRRARTSR